MKYDLIIIGGGPAASAAAVYASRKLLKTLVISGEWGGQSTVSENIKNWIGTNDITGLKLGKDLREHVREYEGDTLKVNEGQLATKIEVIGDYDFKVHTDKGGIFGTKSILIASGSGRRKLEAIGADIFEHKGLTYCASCDGPLFSGQKVAVVGGGNAAFETSLQLSAYCSEVLLLNRSADFRADDITIETVNRNLKISIVTNVVISEVLGDKFVNGIKLMNIETKKVEEISLGGIFVEIGQIPNTGFASDILELDKNKKIVVDPMTQRTAIKGIWSAGDCTNGLYHQNNIAVGDAVKALEDIYIALHRETK